MSNTTAKKSKKKQKSDSDVLIGMLVRMVASLGHLVIDALPYAAKHSMAVGQTVHSGVWGTAQKWHAKLSDTHYRKYGRPASFGLRLAMAAIIVIPIGAAIIAVWLYTHLIGWVIGCIGIAALIQALAKRAH